MATKFILDTHAVVWHLEGNPRLGSSARALIDDLSIELILPAIPFSEAIYIVEKGRCSIPSVPDLLNDLQNDSRIEIYPLTAGILHVGATLTSIPEMHDRLIVATGIYLQQLGDIVEIITKDKDITSSGLLSVRWS